MLPEFGGKIESLVSRATGREWLWRNPQLPIRAAAPGESYVAQHDTGGIDECFPTVSPSLGFADHGELWSKTWTVEAQTTDSLALSVTDPKTRCRFRRAARLTRTAPRLELEYEVENLADRELSFVWCLHPLFAIEPGMQVEIPGEATPIRVHDPNTPGFQPHASKRFAGPLTRGDAALRSADGREALHLRFDPAEIPFVGVWLNFAGWSGAGPGTKPYFNLGIEPSIGDSDNLEEAQARGTAGGLGPRARRTWRVALELGP